jgi:hypothetical protein
MIYDTSIVKLFVFDINDRSSKTYLAIYAMILSAYSIVQYFMIKFTKQMIYENIFTQQKQLFPIHTVVSIATYSQIAITYVIAVDIAINSAYKIYMLSTVIWIGYILAISVLALLIWKFFFWFRSHHNRTVLVYLVALTMLLINGIFTLVYTMDSLESDPVNLTPSRDPVVEFSGTSNPLIVSGYSISNILSFFITWIGTVTLLYHYSRRLGRIKYWVIVSIPLIYFLGQFQSPFLNLFSDFRLTHPFLFGIIFTLIFNSTNPIGGILFGIAFWTIGKHIHRTAVKNYMILSAIGIALLYGSNHSALSVSNAPYPPFGLGSVSFFGLGSYLLLLGIYSTALSVTQDSKLRQTIRKSVEHQSALIDSIGASEMENQIRRKIMDITRKVSVEEELQSSLEEEDIKQYIHEVIKEVKQEKKSK